MKAFPWSKVLHLKVCLGTLSDFVDAICLWADGAGGAGGGAELPAAEGRYICVAPVATCMESFWNDRFRRICDEADFVVPDGIPIVWALRRLGYTEQQRVSGPDLMLRLCAEAERRRIPIALYGGTGSGLERLQENLLRQFPALEIAYAYSPPLRPAGEPAPASELAAIRESGARLLFVGTGCPKQEMWMARHKAELPLVMLGVGAAFLFHSGEVRRAPQWMQRSGLEWLFRLSQEPKRLFKRYGRTNFAFLWHTRLLSGRQLRKYI
ncbi:MAG: WecB/TagA/CpsF family glycosyltransferase [Spirochaetota bacterium]